MMREPRPGEAGSIEQQLDMLEHGKLRGDAIEHAHGRDPEDEDDADIRDADDLNTNYRVDMAETNREGDEMSGDEHSSGLQGTDQPGHEFGGPGDLARWEEQEGLRVRTKII